MSPDEIDDLVDWQLSRDPQLPFRTCGTCRTQWNAVEKVCPECGEVVK